MRVLMISKACIVGAYQRKLEELARLPDIELSVIVPPFWRDPSGDVQLERAYTEGYALLVEPMRFNGNFHLHDYPTLNRRMSELKPDIVHIDEEPYNRATWHALRAARRIGARSLFFSWQNIQRNYPPPFSWGEGWTLRHIDYALAGTQMAADVWRAKGYTGKLAVVPQFGIDPALFFPIDQPRPTDSPFTIGYVGRLVPEKGVDGLMRALASLALPWQLQIAGQGPQRPTLEALATTLGIADRIHFVGQRPSIGLADFYRGLDTLVVPSLTQPNWKEQFGRVIIEANACEVPVIGSSSGAIPDIVGEGGLVVPEGDDHALASALEQLATDAELRRSLGRAGRVQVLDCFTHAHIARQTADVYREMLK